MYESGSQAQRGAILDRLEARARRAIAQEPAQDLGGAGATSAVSPRYRLAAIREAPANAPQLFGGVLVGRDERDPAPVTAELPGADVVEPVRGIRSSSAPDRPMKSAART